MNEIRIMRTTLFPYYKSLDLYIHREKKEISREDFLQKPLFLDFERESSHIEIKNLFIFTFNADIS